MGAQWSEGDGLLRAFRMRERTSAPAQPGGSNQPKEPTSSSCPHGMLSLQRSTPDQEALSYEVTVPASAMQAAESVEEPCNTRRSKATTWQTLTSMRAAYSLGTCRE